MKFKNCQLIINDEKPQKADIQKVAEQGLKYIKNYGNDWYEIDKLFLEDRFLWLYCEYDNSKLYNENVFDGVNDEKVENPRSKNQVELKKQLFACYDISTGFIYLNNLEKRGFISHYIQDILQKNVVIKNIYSSLDDFQNAVKFIKALKFVQKRNVMNIAKDSIFEQFNNIYGLDNPERVKMQVEYDNTPIGQLKNMIQNVKAKKFTGEFEDIILIGRDDNDVEQSFDFSSLMKSIEVTVDKNDNGRYDPNSIKNEFLNKIR